MKHSYFIPPGKYSNLTRDPVATIAHATLLAPLEPEKLRGRIHAALQNRKDGLPVFDWTFPPPVIPKTRAPISAAQLFEHPSVIPGRYGVYLHVPFREPPGSFGSDPGVPGQREADMSRYVEYLLKEAALYAPVLAEQECESLYIGGGTPTHLPGPLLQRLFDGLRRSFRLAPDAEVTVESAPGTIPADTLLLLNGLGVNRLSCIMHAGDRNRLAGFNHSDPDADARAELHNAVRIIGNVNVDTRYDLDGESEGALLEILQEFVDLGIPCISISDLDGRHGNSNQPKGMPAGDDNHERQIAIHRAAREFLAADGFCPVLPGTFLRPERASCRHQLRHWQNLPRVALGVSATGYAPRRPYQNHPSMKVWYERLDRGELPVMEWEVLAPELEIMREVVSQLRLAEVNLAEIRDKYGVDIGLVYRDLIAALVDLGYLASRNGVLWLTDAAARFDNIIPMLFVPDDFKEVIFGLSEQYREDFLLPYILAQVGATQSRPFAIGSLVA